MCLSFRTTELGILPVVVGVLALRLMLFLFSVYLLLCSSVGFPGGYQACNAGVISDSLEKLLMDRELQLRARAAAGLGGCLSSAVSARASPTGAPAPAGPVFESDAEEAAAAASTAAFELGIFSPTRPSTVFGATAAGAAGSTP